MLYLYVGRSILDVCGRRGEKAVRRAVREVAREKGKKLASSYREKGVKTNLETLFAGGNHCSDDPRVRLEVLRQDEDIRIWEIYTCPMASLWLDAGEAGLGTMYCEENQHGLVEGFTGGVGQLNLHQRLPGGRLLPFFRLLPGGQLWRGAVQSQLHRARRGVPALCAGGTGGRP